MIALIAIAGIAVVGGVVGYFFGQPKAFFLIVAVMVLWFIGGWLLGWRTEIGVLSALSAALAASDGTYPLTLIFGGLAFVFLFAQFSLREVNPPSKNPN